MEKDDFVYAKNALKYHGIGSGIVRVISENERIVFENDDSGNEFITTIPRPTYGGTQTSRKSTRRGTQSQTRIMVVELIRDNSKISRQEIAAKIGISEDAVKKHLNKLKRDGVIRREGPDFGGKWIIITDTNKEI